METSWLFKDGPPLSETNRKAKEIAEASELPVIRDSLDSDVVGIGGEKTVVNHPYKEGKVISIVENPKYDTLDAKTRFHIQKILHLLFPTEFPDIHATYSVPNAFVMQKITEAYKPGEVTAPSEKRIDFLNKMQNVGVGIEAVSQNFIADEKGNLFYTDNPSLFSDDINKLEKAIAENLTGKNQEEALRHLERIKGLAEKRKIA